MQEFPDLSCVANLKSLPKFYLIPRYFILKHRLPNLQILFGCEELIPGAADLTALLVRFIVQGEEDLLEYVRDTL